MLIITHTTELPTAQSKDMSNQHKTPWKVDARITNAVIGSDGYTIASAGSAFMAKLICDAVNAFDSRPTPGG